MHYDNESIDSTNMGSHPYSISGYGTSKAVPLKEPSFEEIPAAHAERREFSSDSSTGMSQLGDSALNRFSGMSEFARGDMGRYALGALGAYALYKGWRSRGIKAGLLGTVGAALISRSMGGKESAVTNMISKFSGFGRPF